MNAKPSPVFAAERGQLQAPLSIRSLTLTLCTVLALCSAPAVAHAGGGHDGTAISVKPFTLKDVGGRSFSSAQKLTGKVAVILFWRPGQGQSADALDELVALHKAYSRSGVQFVVIVRGAEGAKHAKATTAKRKLPFPILLDTDDTVYGAFGVIVSPTTYFVDKSGLVHDKYPGLRRDFDSYSRTTLDFLLGKISDKQRAARLEKKGAESWSGTSGSASWYRLGVKELANGQRDDARAHFERAWKSKPKSVDAGTSLGLMLVEDGDAKAALRIFEQVLKMSSENRRAIAGKGVALLRTGKAKRGEKLLRQALTDQIDVPLFYYELGVVCEKSGNAAEAAQYFRRGLEIVIAGQRGHK